LPVTDHSAGTTVLRAIRFAAFRSFYRLPAGWRRRLVRVGTPSFVVGAVVIVRDAAAAPPGRMLLLRQPPGPGWSLPGGLLGRAERPAAGAARELLEETGIRVPADELRPGVPNAVVHTRGRWIDMVFEAAVPAGDTFTLDRAEVHEARWHPVDALPPLTPQTAQLLAHYGLGPQADDPKDD
jgi:ADP-ribose pyrophosphatase YjhB (NUDIX family)